MAYNAHLGCWVKNVMKIFISSQLLKKIDVTTFTSLTLGQPLRHLLTMKSTHLKKRFRQIQQYEGTSKQEMVLMVASNNYCVKYGTKIIFINNSDKVLCIKLGDF